MLDKILEKNRLKTSHYTDQEFSDYGNFSVASAMKEYAEWYATECLKIAAEQVTFQYGEFDVEGFSHKEIVGIDYDSILNIKLPEHD